MSVSLTFPYKSRYMRNLDDLLSKAGLTNLEDLIHEALTYRDIMQEGNDTGMYMVSCAYDNTDDLQVIDDQVTAEHMPAGSIDLELEDKSAANIKALSGADNLEEFFTGLLVMYEQVAHALHKGHGIALFHPDRLVLGWTRVTRDTDPLPASSYAPAGPLLN